MPLKNEYLLRIYDTVVQKNIGELEFHQAVLEFLESLEPVLEKEPELAKTGVIDRMIEPERLVQFRVSWIDDAGVVQVNRAYRVQFNSAIGPYKGGFRFHPSVNASILKFLAFEQVYKNSLTGLPMGGGKGGADFDPKGKSENEIMRFCQALMVELSRHIGADVDVPAGDIGVGAREVGYMFGQYKKIKNEFTGVFTGKGLSYGGSLARKEATGYGLIYFTQEALKNIKNTDLNGKRVLVSGSGNVATYAVEKAQTYGAKVLSVSDSSGYIHDPNGINLEVLKQIKEVERARISEYAKRVPGSQYFEGCKGVWSIPCDIALPCATQNELDLDSAQLLIQNGVTMVAEGANMPSTPEAVHALMEAGVLFAPAKAANAGGVSVSVMEMSQNAIKLMLSDKHMDERLKEIMEHMHQDIFDTCEEYDLGYDLITGANITAFERVADTMIRLGTY
ncbi:MAG: NADP-specific glutamate dehydrogenase [Fibrobacter sp.]|nr:NADP-specific glutamate dehydrogenase [Fibrobacter sp.]